MQHRRAHDRAQQPEANGKGRADDIDHLGNRRVRAVGELIQNAVPRRPAAHGARGQGAHVDPGPGTARHADALINIRPVVAAMREFFGGSQLSQFMDQTNPLAELTHKRRLSALGPGGLQPRPRRLRGARRAPLPLRPHLPDRDAGRPEHRPDRLAGDLRADQRVRLHRDALPPGHATTVDNTTGASWSARRLREDVDRRRTGEGDRRGGHGCDAEAGRRRIAKLTDLARIKIKPDRLATRSSTSRPTRRTTTSSRRRTPASTSTATSCESASTVRQRPASSSGAAGARRLHGRFAEAGRVASRRR